MDPLTRYRTILKAHLKSGDMDKAWFTARIIVGLRIVMGEIGVKLRRNNVVEFKKPSQQLNG